MFMVDNPDLGKVRSAAKALLKSGTKLPPQRRVDLECVVSTYFNVEKVDEEFLNTVMEMDIRVENKKFVGLHGERVVHAVQKEGHLLDFIRMWRQRFLDLMQPKHLPPLWSVEHNLHKINKST